MTGLRLRVALFTLVMFVVGAMVWIAAIDTAHGKVPHAIYRINTSEKVVALTFDDGPHPVYTPKILKILDKYSVKVTFFMVGHRMEKNPEIVQAVIRGGHAIGNHTYTHPLGDRPITGNHLKYEMDMDERVVEKMVGRRTDLYRPPKGLINNRVLESVRQNGCKTILWSVCIDHHDAPTPKLMAQRVFDRLQPGIIILAHDGVYPMRWKDVVATEIIIKELRKRGYRFVTVPELLKIGSQKKHGQFQR